MVDGDFGLERGRDPAVPTARDLVRDKVFLFIVHGAVLGQVDLREQ